MAPKSKRTVRTSKTSNELDIARKIWLAGVGAYGRMFDEAQDQVVRLSHNATEMFDDLVVRGEKVEDEVRARITKSDAGSRVVKLVERAQEFGAERRKAFQKRVAVVRSTVAESLSAPMNMFMLGQTVEALAKRVEKLTGFKSPLKASKAVKAVKTKTVKAVKAVRKAKSARRPKNARVIEGVDGVAQRNAA